MVRTVDKTYSNLLEAIKHEPPSFADKKIKKWDKDLTFITSSFMKDHYWNSHASINVFRVVGTKHPDYAGLTWGEFIKSGKRMHINIPLHTSNPGYYYETTIKEPKMFFLSLDGGDLFIGDDGNHRTAIAMFELYYKRVNTIHGVSLDEYKVDWELKKQYEELVDVVAHKKLPYVIKPCQKCISREDTAGWKMDRFENKLSLRDVQTGKESLLDYAQVIELKDSIGANKFLKLLGLKKTNGGNHHAKAK